MRKTSQSNNFVCEVSVPTLGIMQASLFVDVGVILLLVLLIVVTFSL